MQDPGGPYINILKPREAFIKNLGMKLGRGLLLQCIKMPKEGRKDRSTKSLYSQSHHFRYCTQDGTDFGYAFIVDTGKR
jgi:hypothetical protein